MSRKDGLPDQRVIKITAMELKDRIEGKIILALYDLNAYNENSIGIETLKEKVGDSKITSKLKKLENAGIIVTVTSLVSKNKYVSLTELGKSIAEEMKRKEPVKVD